MANKIMYKGDPGEIQLRQSANRRFRFKNAKIDASPAITTLLRIKDEQDACNRYVTYNIPLALTSEALERHLYYRGQVILFYLSETDEFCVMPYTLAQGLDYQSRWLYVTPVPWTSEPDVSSPSHASWIRQRDFLATKKLKVIYDVLDEVDEETFNNSCVILRDYTPQNDINHIIPRQQLNDTLIQLEADMIPYMHTCCMIGSGVKGVTVTDSDEVDEIDQLSNEYDKAAKTGYPYLALKRTMEMQDLGEGSILKPGDFMQAMQSLDEFRKSIYGIESGGVFDKKAYVNEVQSLLGNSNSQLNDGLALRQHAYDIANSIWGLGLYCECKEAAVGTDLNGDSLIYDSENIGGIENDNDIQQEEPEEV